METKLARIDKTRNEGLGFIDVVEHAKNNTAAAGTGIHGAAKGRIAAA